MSILFPPPRIFLQKFNFLQKNLHRVTHYFLLFLLPQLSPFPPSPSKRIIADTQMQPIDIAHVDSSSKS